MTERERKPHHTLPHAMTSAPFSFRTVPSDYNGKDGAWRHNTLQTHETTLFTLGFHLTGELPDGYERVTVVYGRYEYLRCRRIYAVMETDLTVSSLFAVP